MEFSKEKDTVDVSPTDEVVLYEDVKVKFNSVSDDSLVYRVLLKHWNPKEVSPPVNHTRKRITQKLRMLLHSVPRKHRPQQLEGIDHFHSLASRALFSAAPETHKGYCIGLLHSLALLRGLLSAPHEYWLAKGIAPIDHGVPR